MTRRFVRSSAVALYLAAGFMIPPVAVHAAPGDLILRKAPPAPTAAGADARTPRAVTGSFDGAVSGAAPPPPPKILSKAARERALFPHEIYGKGFDPAHSMGSRARLGKVDLFQKMRERAEKRQALGPDAAPMTVASYPGEDTIRIAMLRVDFLNDRGGNASSGDGRFDLSPRDTLNRPLDPTPHNRAFFQSHGEALRRYYRDQMGGRVVFEYSVYPTASDSAFHLTDMADYGPWKFSTEIYQAAVKLFHDALVSADTTESIPWGAFDRVVIVHAGSDLQSDVNADSPEDIPTFTIGVADTDAVAVGPAKADTVFSAIIGPESIRQDGYEGTINAVYAHEHGHLVFGWRDVYDVQSGLPTVGYWSLMDTGNLVGNAVQLPNGNAVYATGILPPAVDPWQKQLVYDDMPATPEPAYGAEVSLGDIEQNFQVYKVPLSGEEYLLLENRLDDINGNGSLELTRDPTTGVILGPSGRDTLEYDFLVPGPGILAWHVDESVANFFGPRADPNFGLNVNRGRFGLQIIEADGLDDLGDFNSPFALGTATDPWSTSTYARLNDTTVPRLLTNSETHPHLDLTFTSAPGPIMTLRVDRLWDLPGWPAHVVQPPAGIVPAISRLGTDAQVRVAWAGGDSAVHVRNADGTPMVPGAPDDIVFRANGPLRPVAVVRRDDSNGGSFLAATEDTPGATGELHLIHVLANGAIGTIQTVSLAATVTAGPATRDFPITWLQGSPYPSTTYPAPVYVGLANGDVVGNVFTGAFGAEVATPTPVASLNGRITGLAAVGSHVMAASLGGDLAADDEVRAGVLTPGHVWQPLAYAYKGYTGNLAPPCLGSVCGDFRLALVDRTVGALRVFSNATLKPIPIDQNHALGEPINAPAIDDIDGDGLPEILFTTVSGKAGYWNDNGSLSPGWPPRVEREGFVTKAGPLPLTRSGASSLLLVSAGNGLLTALDANQKPAPGFPLGLSVGARGTGALDTGNLLVDGPPVLFIADGDSLLRGFALASLGTQGTAAVSAWSHEGGTPGRAYVADRLFSTAASITSSSTAILPGTFMCYPNPARQLPVTFAFRLRDPGKVTIRIFDPAAREVDAITRDAGTSDNAIVWDPGTHPSGLYLARVEAGGQVVTQPFAIVR